MSFWCYVGLHDWLTVEKAPFVDEVFVGYTSIDYEDRVCRQCEALDLSLTKRRTAQEKRFQAAKAQLQSETEQRARDKPILERAEVRRKQT